MERQDGLSRMITGIFDDNRGLLVRAPVSDGSRPYHEIEFAIAPSTNAGLALPRRYITELGLSRMGETNWMLGGIDQQDAPCYIAYAEWVHGLSPVFVVETPGGAADWAGAAARQFSAGGFYGRRRSCGVRH